MLEDDMYQSVALFAAGRLVLALKVCLIEPLAVVNAKSDVGVVMFAVTAEPVRIEN